MMDGFHLPLTRAQAVERFRVAALSHEGRGEFRALHRQYKTREVHQEVPVNARELFPLPLWERVRRRMPARVRGHAH